MLWSLSTKAKSFMELFMLLLAAIRIAWHAAYHYVHPPALVHAPMASRKLLTFYGDNAAQSV